MGQEIASARCFDADGTAHRLPFHVAKYGRDLRALTCAYRAPSAAGEPVDRREI